MRLRLKCKQIGTGDTSVLISISIARGFVYVIGFPTVSLGGVDCPVLTEERYEKNVLLLKSNLGQIIKIEAIYVVTIRMDTFVISSPEKILCKTKKTIVKEIIGRLLPIILKWPAEGHPLPQGKDFAKHSGYSSFKNFFRYCMILQIA